MLLFIFLPVALRRLLLAMGLCALCTAAWAQTSSTTIDFGPFVKSSTLWDAIGVAASGLLGWLLQRAGNLLKIQIDDRVRAYLDDILHKGIALAQAQAGSLPMQVDVGSAFVAAAANFTIAHAPGALKWFGIDTSGDAVKNMVAARTQLLMNSLVPPTIQHSRRGGPAVTWLTGLLSSLFSTLFQKLFGAVTQEIDTEQARADQVALGQARQATADQAVVITAQQTAATADSQPRGPRSHTGGAR